MTWSTSRSGISLGSRIDLESAKQVVLVGIFVNIGAFDLD